MRSLKHVNVLILLILHFFVALNMLAIFYPLVIGFLLKSQEELKDTDTNELLENPDMVAQNYKLPAYINDLRKILPILLSEGYLD